MITIHLNDLRFYAFHGVYEEEKILGNEFVINAFVAFDEAQNIISSIQDTINYTSVYNIIKAVMSIPTSLLETVIMAIGNEIYNHFKFINYIKISIVKLHPPIEGIEGSVGVIWEKQF